MILKLVRLILRDININIGILLFVFLLSAIKSFSQEKLSFEDLGKMMVAVMQDKPDVADEIASHGNFKWDNSLGAYFNDRDILFFDFKDYQFSVFYSTPNKKTYDSFYKDLSVLFTIKTVDNNNDRKIFVFEFESGVWLLEHHFEEKLYVLQTFSGKFTSDFMNFASNTRIKSNY